MTLSRTEEQRAIIDAAVNTTGNIMVTARAGSAKTTTLIWIAEAMPRSVTGLTLAFNAKIRDEMRDRMPSNFTAMTLNGIGYSAWRRFISRPTRVWKTKNYNLLKEQIDKLDKDEQSAAWETFGDTLRAIAAGKNAGYLYDNTSAAYKPLITEEDFFGEFLEINATELQRELINRVTKLSWEKTKQGILDFDDMILAPAVAGVSFDSYDMVLIDEAQDLSAINHVLVQKIVKSRSRVILVGDPCQAIYGFRGADTTSMNKLGKMFDAKPFSLTTSFRCSQAVTENARWRAPDMRWPDWAKPGLVLHAADWASEDIPDGAAVLCRNNAPLFAMAIRLLRDGRYPELAGRDIIKNVVAKLKKVGKPSVKRESALLGVSAWLETEKLRHKDHRLLEDTAACLKIFIGETETLGDAIAFAQRLGGQAGHIQLMTGHRAKGLEFEKVFFLDHFLCTKNGQDPNIKYVIETRAIDDLIYVDSKTYETKESDE